MRLHVYPGHKDTMITGQSEGQNSSSMGMSNCWPQRMVIPRARVHPNLWGEKQRNIRASKMVAED